MQSVVLNLAVAAQLHFRFKCLFFFFFFFAVGGVVAAMAYCYPLLFVINVPFDSFFLYIYIVQYCTDIHFLHFSPFIQVE